MPDELCVPQEFLRRWPRDAGAARRLCEFSGYLEGEIDPDVFDESNPPDFFTGPRHILMRATMPGRENPCVLVMERHGWCVPCEPALAEFVLARAEEWLVHRGVNPGVASAWLRPPRGKNEGQERRLAPCGVGYERGGLCTTLILGADSKRAFLKCQPGFLVPELPPSGSGTPHGGADGPIE